MIGERWPFSSGWIALAIFIGGVSLLWHELPASTDTRVGYASRVPVHVWGGSWEPHAPPAELPPSFLGSVTGPRSGGRTEDDVRRSDPDADRGSDSRAGETRADGGNTNEGRREAERRQDSAGDDSSTAPVRRPGPGDLWERLDDEGYPIYVVRKKDSYYAIARRLGRLSLTATIERLNPKYPARKLRSGVEIRLPKVILDDSGSATKARPPSERWREHTVRPNETLSEIAHQYGVEMNAIVRANPKEIPRPELIRAGSVIKIPPGAGR